jgi:hypothetical protein
MASTPSLKRTAMSVWQGERIDITRRVKAPEAITTFLYEELVFPTGLAPYKDARPPTVSERVEGP